MTAPNTNFSLSPSLAQGTAAHITLPEPEMLNAALWYARRGYYVFPVHKPLFDQTGQCIGCTCEPYKRSEKYRQFLIEKGRERKYDPAYTCLQPGKCPAVNWRDKSTIDPDQIHKWWGRPWRAGSIQYQPNIGIDCGKSGLLVLDLDVYKDGYMGEHLLSWADQQTLTTISGGGGQHLYFDRGDAAYGNTTGTLPQGIDIRGVGGCIVAPPSLHQSGRCYQWEDGYGPHECALKPIPDRLRAILDIAHHQKKARSTANTVTFGQVSIEAPALARWELTAATLELIHHPLPKGQRSEHDMKVVIALCAAGADDDDVLAIFEHYPIGQAGKFVEQGGYGKDYLALTITNARAYLAEQTRKLQQIHATIDALRVWILTHSFAEYIAQEQRRSIYRTDSSDTKVADAVCDLFTRRRALTIKTGKKRLAKEAGVSPNTVINVLHRLQGWLFVVTTSPDGLTITLCDEFVSRSLTPLPNVMNDLGGQSTPIETVQSNEYSSRKATDPFLTGTSHTVKERAREASIVAGRTLKEWLATVPSGLGETCLRELDVLQRCGEMTVVELVNETGKTLGAIRRASRRLELLGLVTSTRAHSRAPKVYQIADNVWQQVDALAPTLRTHLLSAERANRQMWNSQCWLMTQKAIAVKTGDHSRADDVDKQILWLGNQRFKYLKLIYADTQVDRADLACLAFDVYLPSMPHPSVMTKLEQYHAAARLEVTQAQRREQCDLINTAGELRKDGLDKKESVRMLHLAGYSLNEAWQAIQSVWKTPALHLSPN